MNGTTIASAQPLYVVDTAWVIQGFGDLNADGFTDVVWRDPSTGQAAVWLMNGTAIFSTNQPTVLSGGVADACASNLGVARIYEIGVADGTTEVTIRAGGGYVPSPVFAAPPARWMPMVSAWCASGDSAPTLIADTTKRRASDRASSTSSSARASRSRRT